jgi:hypothetical protein
MPKLTVNARNDLHPKHLELMEFECNTGLDISLLPDFEVEVEVSEEEYTQHHADAHMQ